MRRTPARMFPFKTENRIKYNSSNPIVTGIAIDAVDGLNSRSQPSIATAFFK